MYVNGFIIQKAVNNGYRGVDGSGFSLNSGENWYLNNNDDYRSQFEPFYEEHIGRDHWILPSHTWVAACTDLEYVRKYILVYEELGIKYRILVVLTDIPAPSIELDSNMKLEFLGYDYAYENGDNYSAVYNEIPYVFPNIRLNNNGLIQTREEMDAYLKQREKFIDSHPKYTLEYGDFTVFKVFEAIL